MPLIFWYDKIHVAKKSYYLELIFNKKGYYDELKKSYQKTVSFVEDSYGTATMKAIRNRP
jgi:effector-binding domain-containing protein